MRGDSASALAWRDASEATPSDYRLGLVVLVFSSLGGAEITDQSQSSSQGHLEGRNIEIVEAINSDGHAQHMHEQSATPWMTGACFRVRMLRGRAPLIRGGLPAPPLQ